MKLSILTATYNRGQYLKKLYDSIIKNLIDEIDIEWLIMDDGSTDNTEKIVKEFLTTEKLTIKYYTQVNCGKMQAINELMKYVTGEIVMDCDSDDYFHENAFQEIYNKKDVLLKDNNLYALAFLKNENENVLSGNKFVYENQYTTMFDMYFKQNIVGEKILVFKTNIRKKYCHELEQGEKFITEARMYHKMDLKYKVKCFNIILVVGKYLSDGYTNNLNKIFGQAPKGYCKYFKEILENDMKGVKISKRLYAIKHYILFSYLAKEKVKLCDIKDYLNKFLIIILYIPGIFKTKIRKKYFY